ncbi:EF-hand calcium-binding domain-containing protein 5 isoform X1 [Melanerpes formicivorus]|uniref:EF-hand calcium-binding domain-containing protein 5 isoform X1 n=1 Tax=Melanerpes formicivorus TaxID=211600 RepID=UPI00358FAE8C
MAAQPEAAAQTAGLKHPKAGVKNLTATDIKRNQGHDELPCLSDDAQWKECFYEKVHQRCLRLQERKVKMIHAQKAEEEKIKKREPCDLLSREWFSEDKESLDTRVYLLDKLLPTLMPGIEKLSMEVEKKNMLAPDQEPVDFNPIHFLGEYLMRHNPLRGFSPKPSPYLRGMKMVLEELKAEMPGTASERLARMKAEVKSKREAREQLAAMKSKVKEMRKEALAIQFKEWTVDVSDRIPVALVQSALKSFQDAIASAPMDVKKAICDRKLEFVDTLEKTISIDEFTEYVHSFTEHFSNDMFQEILKHLHQCADDFQEAVRHDMWRQMFAELFLVCDYGKVGLLNRQKILALLKDFHDRSPVAAKEGFCNPSQWPLIQLQDMELADLWGGLDQEVCEELSEKTVLSQTGVSEGEIFPCEPADDDRQGTHTMRTSASEELFEQMDMNEAETGGIPKEEHQAPESSDAELREEGENTVSAAKSIDFEGSDLDGGTTHSEKPSFHEEIETERQTESAGADTQEEAFQGSASTEYSLRGDGEPGAEEQMKEEEFSLGREPNTETNREEDHPTSDREPGSEGQVSQEGHNWITETTNTIPEPAAEAPIMTSEDRAVTDMDVIDSNQDAPVAELVKETPARKESFSRQHSSQVGQQTSTETRPQDEDVLQERDLRPIMAEVQNRWASHARSAFDESCLNLPQFVQLMETFVGENISLPTVKRLVAFIRGEYKQTEEEKTEQLEKAHRVSCLAQQQLLLEALFEKWDNNASGFLDLEEVDAVLNTFKEGMEKEAVRKAKKQLCTRYPQLSRVGKLSPKAFQSFLELVASELTGDEDEAIDNLVEFLTTRVERSDMECLKSLERRKWLYNIQQAAETSGASMEPVYKAVFKALSQDAEAHGDNKKISSYIALLEENQLSPERGQILLHYVACTADDAPYVLNQILYKDMKGVSFAAVEEGKPIHVPNVQLHGNIHFWNYDRPTGERKGSFLVLPLQDAHWRAFGILGLDTLRDQREKTVIMAHEISFYQGVSRAFSKAYLHICMLQNVLQIAVTALEWLYPRAPSIHTVSMYLVEPGKDKPGDYALRKMVTTHNTGQKEIHSSPALLLRKENLLRNYLFKCTDSSEVTCTSLWGEHHIAVPLRDLSGQALGIFDISIGRHQKLPPHEQKDLQKMLKMAQAACWEILKKSTEETEPTCVLEAEGLAHLKNAGILFHRFMLQDLRECIRKLDADSFAQIKSQVEPPALVHNIVKAVLVLFHPDWKGSEETENWSRCKLKLDDNLIEEIYCFDPTATSVHIQVELLLDCITGVPIAAVQQHSSIPAQHLYHWLHTCLSLAAIARSLRSNKPFL